MPTHEHFPVSKQDGGKEAVDNAILAHRLCNRIDYSIRVGRSHARDLERIRKAREEAKREQEQRAHTTHLNCTCCEYVSTVHRSLNALAETGLLGCKTVFPKIFLFVHFSPVPTQSQEQNLV